ncbi:hypothetical protein [Escherichia phage vB_EcoM_JNE01]|nr:hypothetical protein [Escherichia phage vB_EcoM_JNE01]
MVQYSARYSGMLSSPLAKMVTVEYCCNSIQYYFLIDTTLNEVYYVPRRKLGFLT